MKTFFFIFLEMKHLSPKPHELGWVCFYTCDGLGLEFSNPSMSSQVVKTLQPNLRTPFLLGPAYKVGLKGLECDLATLPIWPKKPKILRKIGEKNQHMHAPNNLGGIAKQKNTNMCKVGCK